MNALACLLGGLLLASPSPIPPPGSPSPSAKEQVIVFLIDNSASLPPLDPSEKRVAALEKMFTFLKGRPYRLILFGGRREIMVDDPSRYNNRGQWTDFYFAFDKAKAVMESYPKGTEFRIVLLTDGLLDPGPADWQDMGVPAGADLKEFVAQRTLELLRSMKTPLYVILVGEIPPPEQQAKNSPEQAPAIVIDMARAANGAEASRMAQSLSSFFKDDGVLLKKFVFRVEPQEGLKKVTTVIQRITAPSKPGVEVQFLTFFILPLSLFLFLMLGVFVRSFPGPGDVEVIELSTGQPVHIGVDRAHRLQGGGWGTRGLCLAKDPKDAAATLTYQSPPLDLGGVGIDATGLDAVTQKLLPLPLTDLKKTLDGYASSGSKEEKIYALNLDYMAKNFDPAEAEKILTGPLAERRRAGALDFLRAKVHLLSNDELRKRLTESRVQLITYGKRGAKQDLAPGTVARINRYGFLVKDVNRGGKRDVRLVLYYDRVPSLLGLKAILPDGFQRLFRMRRSSQRVVS